MPFCEKCGSPVKSDSNFCRNCGAPQNVQTNTQSNDSHVSAQQNNNNSSESSAGPTAFQQPFRQSAPEQVVDFIIVSRSKRFGGKEYFTGILTHTQLIFAPMTNDMIKEVTNISKQQAKSKCATTTAIYPYQQRYLTASPSAILNQSPGGFSIQNSSIREINVKTVNAVSDGYSDFEEYEMKIVSDLQTLTFYMTKREEYVFRLRQVYQEKIRLS
jgi:hypothetical protein